MTMDQKLNNQEEIKQTTASSAMLAGFGGILLTPHILKSKHARKFLGYVGGSALNTVAQAPLGFMRGLLSDNEAIANPDKFKYLTDPEDLSALSEAKSLFSESSKRLVDANDEKLLHSDLYKKAIGSYEKAAKRAKKTIGTMRRTDSGVHFKFTDGTEDVVKETRAATKYFASIDKTNALYKESGALFHQALGAAPTKAMLDPGNIFRGLRGYMSNPSGKHSIPLLPFKAMNNVAAAPRLGLIPSKITELVGHAAGRAAKSLPLLTFNIGADLLRGAGKDFLGIGKGGGSSIIRTAKMIALAKIVAPLSRDIYYNSISSESSIGGNPMLTNIANSAAKVKEGSNYQVNMERTPSAAAARVNTVQSDSRRRFVASAAGLSHSLGKISGRVM